MKSDLIKSINHILAGNECNLSGLNEDELKICRYTVAVNANLKGDSLLFNRILEEFKIKDSFLYHLLNVRNVWNEKGYNCSSNDLDICRDYLETAEDYLKVEFYLLEGTARLSLEKYEKALDSFSRVTDICLENKFYERLGRAYYNSLLCYEAFGDFYNFEIALLKLKTLCSDNNLPDISLLYAKVVGFRKLELGEFTEGNALLTHAIENYSHQKWSNELFSLRKILAYIQLRQGSFNLFEKNLNEMHQLVVIRNETAWKNTILLLRLEYYIKSYQVDKAIKIIEVLNSLKLGQDKVFFDQFKLKLSILTGDWPTNGKKESLARLREISKDNYPYEDGFKEDCLIYDLLAGGKLKNNHLNDLIAFNEKNRRVYNIFKLKLVACLFNVLALDHDAVVVSLRSICGYLKGTGQNYEYLVYLYVLKEHLLFNFNKFLNKEELAELDRLSSLYGESYKVVFKLFPFNYLKFELFDDKFSFNYRRKEIKRNSETIVRNELGSLEWLFFNILYNNKSVIIKNEEFVDQLWKEIYNPEIHNQRIYQIIVSLRKMLINARINPSCLQNVPGVGYMLVIDKDNGPENEELSFDRIINNYKIDDQIFAKDIAIKLDTSLRTIQRKLSRLVEDKKVEAVGTSKNRHYLKK